MRFQYSITHVPGKTLYMADTLSRAPVSAVTQEITSDTEMFMQSDSYRTAQMQDHTCFQLIQFCNSVWPNRNTLKGELNKYWQVHANLTVNENLLLFGSRIVPAAMRTETLRKIHCGHQGFQRCRSRATTTVWWPGITKTLENFIKACPECQQTILSQREPLLSTPPAKPFLGKSCKWIY